jgi:hypothetical protein
MAGTEQEDVVNEDIAAKDIHDVDAIVALLDPNFVNYDPDIPEPRLSEVA